MRRTARIGMMFLALASLPGLGAGAEVRRASGPDIGAEAQLCKPGDTLILPPRDYLPDKRVRTEGVAIVSEYPLAARIQGGEIGLTIYMVPGVRVEGIDFTGQSDRGLWINQAQRATVLGCRFTRTGKWGPFSSYTDDAVIERNESSGQTQHGIYVSNSGDRPIVRWNYLHDNLRCGLQLNGDRKQMRPELGTRGDGIITGAVIEFNRIERNGLDPKNRGAAVNLMVVREALVRYNVLRDNLGGGISYGSDMPARVTDAGSTGNVTEFNVVSQARAGLACLRASGSSTGNTWRGNVLDAGRGGLYDVTEDSKPSLALERNTEAYQVPTARREPVRQEVVSRTGS